MKIKKKKNLIDKQRIPDSNITYSHLFHRSQFFHHQLHILMILLLIFIFLLLLLPPCPPVSRWQVGLNEDGLCASDVTAAVGARVPV